MSLRPRAILCAIQVLLTFCEVQRLGDYCWFKRGLPYKGAELLSRQRVCMGGRRAGGLSGPFDNLKASAQVP